MIISKFKTISVIIFSFISLFSVSNYAQITDINSYQATYPTSDKPQSKVWKHDGQWWCIMPTTTGVNPSGTWLFHLDNNDPASWQSVIRLDSYTNAHADCKVYGDKTYVLLVHGSSADLYELTYSVGTETYTSSSHIQTLTIHVHETATIDIDSEGEMWVAWDGTENTGDEMNVIYSSPPDYNSWSTPITLATTGDNDDICAVTAFNGKIGVMWSHQTNAEDYFEFASINAGSSPTNSNDFTYDSPIKRQVGSNKSFADDHINLAAGSDGKIYAAVKTSYGSSGDYVIGLLVRSTTGTWTFHPVQSGDNGNGTRPIVLLDEGYNTITVFYTSATGGGDIVYKSSPTGAISFPSGNPTVLHSGSNWNNATSTKQNINVTGDTALVLYSDGNTWHGKEISINALPVELAFFNGHIDGNSTELNWKTVTEVNNYGFNIERAYNNYNWLVIGFVEGHSNSNSPKEYHFTDSNINQPGRYSYRLKQIDNDGTFEYSDIVTVNVSTPDGYYLSQNYPNPFNPTTTIDYMISNEEKVSLKVYDLLGREVASLVDEYKPAGTYSVSFNADKLATGVYIYRLVAGEYVSVKRMSLIK